MTRVVLIILAYCWITFSLAWMVTHDMIFKPVRNWMKVRIDTSRLLRTRPMTRGYLTYAISCAECTSFWIGLVLAPVCCRLLDWQPCMLKMVGLAIGAKGITTVILRRMIRIWEL